MRDLDEQNPDGGVNLKLDKPHSINIPRFDRAEPKATGESDHEVQGIHDLFHHLASGYNHRSA